MNKVTLKSLLVISILLNLILGATLFLHFFNSPSEKIGILTRDINAGPFMKPGVSFELPEGLIVKDVSPRGFDAIGRFEPNRFGIVITTDQDSVVNYDINPDTLKGFSNHYSMDYPINEDRTKQSQNN